MNEKRKKQAIMEEKLMKFSSHIIEERGASRISPLKGIHIPQVQLPLQAKMLSSLEKPLSVPKRLKLLNNFLIAPFFQIKHFFHASRVITDSLEELPTCVDRVDLHLFHFQKIYLERSLLTKKASVVKVIPLAILALRLKNLVDDLKRGRSLLKWRRNWAKKLVGVEEVSLPLVEQKKYFSPPSISI